MLHFVAKSVDAIKNVGNLGAEFGAVKQDDLLHFPPELPAALTQLFVRARQCDFRRLHFRSRFAL